MDQNNYWGEHYSWITPDRLDAYSMCDQSHLYRLLRFTGENTAVRSYRVIWIPTPCEANPICIEFEMKGLLVRTLQLVIQDDLDVANPICIYLKGLLGRTLQLGHTVLFGCLLYVWPISFVYI